jgi:hypothetical protein
MAKNTLSIVIPEIANQELVVDIIGRTPLLIKRFDEKTQQGIEEAQQGVAKRKKEPRQPAEECERARIKDDKGRDCIRAIWLKKGMAAMGGYFGIPRGNVEQGVYVVGDLLPIQFDGKKPIMNTARVRVGMGGMAKTSVAYRPEFRNWSCKGVRIGFDASVLTPHQVVSLLNHAGGKNGIGEWRPQKGGDFGRFDVVPAGSSKKMIEEARAASLKAAKAETVELTKKKPGPKKKGLVEEVTEQVEEIMAPKKRGPKPKAKPMVAAKSLRRPAKTVVDADAMLEGMTPTERKQLADNMKKRFGF